MTLINFLQHYAVGDVEVNIYCKLYGHIDVSTFRYDAKGVISRLTASELLSSVSCVGSRLVGNKSLLVINTVENDN